MFNLINDVLNHSNWFERPFYESEKYAVYKDAEKNTETIVANTLGIAAEDLVLEFSEEDSSLLVLKGETKNDIIGTMSISYSWKINTEVVQSIDMEVKDGYTYITLAKKEIQNKIAINRK